MAYLELTNMGDFPVQLSDFYIGHRGGKSTLIDGQSNMEDYQIPVDTLLPPGASYLFASWSEYEVRKINEGNIELFFERRNQQNVLEKDDFLVDLEESQYDDGTDMVTENFYYPFNEQWGPGMKSDQALKSYYLIRELRPVRSVLVPFFSI